jgi:hypothetical protein
MWPCKRKCMNYTSFGGIVFAETRSEFTRYVAWLKGCRHGILFAYTTHAGGYFLVQRLKLAVVVHDLHEQLVQLLADRTNCAEFGQSRSMNRHSWGIRRAIRQVSVAELRRNTKHTIGVLHFCCLYCSVWRHSFSITFQGLNVKIKGGGLRVGQPNTRQLSNATVQSRMGTRPGKIY